MNPYLFSLMTYAVLITPLRLMLRIRFGRRTSYRLRLQAIGLPLYRSRRDEDDTGERPIDQLAVSQQMQSNKLRVLRALLSSRFRRQLFRTAHLEHLSVYAHISQPDAMQNALLFGSLRTLSEVLVRLLPLPLRIHLRTDHQGQGSEAMVRCIFTMRLGSLLPAALLWLWHMVRLRKRKEPSKEEKYAASH